MKKSLSVLMMVSLIAPNVFAAKGDVSIYSKSTIIRTDVVDVGSCNYSPSIGMKGQLVAQAKVSYLECIETETYQVKETQGDYWSSTSEKIAGSDRRSFQLVSSTKDFTDMNSMINGGQRAKIDPDLNGDGQVTETEERRAYEIEQEERINNAINDVARSAVGHVQVMADCNNFASRLRMVTRTYNQLPVECRR